MGLSTHLLITYLSTHPCKRFPVISSLFLFVNLILVQVPLPITSSSSNSPRCTSITSPLFHSRLKTYLFHKSYPPPFPVVSLLPPGLPPRIFAWIVSAELLGFWFYFFLIIFVSGQCARLSWPSRQLLSARYLIPYRIVLLLLLLLLLLLFLLLLLSSCCHKSLNWSQLAGAWNKWQLTALDVVT